MASLKDIRKRINAIKSTRKITKVMTLISASRFKKFELILKKAEAYLNTAIDIAQVTKSSNLENNKMVLLIVLGSDKGLCGSFNTKIFNKLKKTIDFLTAEKFDYRILSMGNKLNKNLEKIYNEKILLLDSIYKGKNSKLHQLSSELSKKVSSYIDEYNASQCNIIYTKFLGHTKYEVKNEKLLPIEKTEEKNYTMDNNPEILSIKTLEYFLDSYLFFAYVNSLVSEYFARMIAMDAATRNSKNLLKDLERLYNNKRQAAVTKEIIEIVSGAQALIKE